jgi:predicted HAD superfamily Cof-like phosphohydrolase
VSEDILDRAAHHLEVGSGFDHREIVRELAQEVADLRIANRELRLLVTTAQQAVEGKRSLISLQVAEFHTAFGQVVNGTPTIPDEAMVRLRARIVLEEAFEFAEALFDSASADVLHEHFVSAMRTIESAGIDVDMEAAADALGDLDYVVEGSRLVLGVNGVPIAAEIHRANMSKLGPDGKPIKREDGKIVKPAGWTPPAIGEELLKQGWRP